MEIGDRVWYKLDVLRGLGTVIALTQTGKSAMVQWPNPYNSSTLAYPLLHRVNNLKVDNK